MCPGYQPCGLIHRIAVEVDVESTPTNRRTFRDGRIGLSSMKRWDSTKERFLDKWSLEMTEGKAPFTKGGPPRMIANTHHYSGI